MRELPRQLTVDELAELFEGRTLLVERLAGVEYPLDHADAAISTLTDEQRREALNAHPAIGQSTGLSERSAREQGPDADPAVGAELARQNAAYESRHGFRFVVFVDRRPKDEILEVLRERIDRPSSEELETGLHELVAIARDRWLRG